MAENLAKTDFPAQIADYALNHVKKLPECDHCFIFSVKWDKTEY